MARGRLERQVDDALLALSMSAGIVYVRRRLRRVGHRALRAAQLLAGAGLALALLAAAGGVLARRRRGSG